MMIALTHCKKCNGYHPVGDQVSAQLASRRALDEANTNSPIVPADAPRKRLTVKEAIERSKAEYKKTLAYLA